MLVAAIVIGLVRTLGAVPAPTAKRVLAHGDDMRITFPHPDDWRCVSSAQCTTCTNVSRTTSRLVVVQGPKRQKREHDVPSGSSIQLCAE